MFLSAEAITWRCSVKEVLLEVFQNSQESICSGVSALIKMQTEAATLLKKDSGTGFFV